MPYWAAPSCPRIKNRSSSKREIKCPFNAHLTPKFVWNRCFCLFIFPWNSPNAASHPSLKFLDQHSSTDLRGDWQSADAVHDMSSVPEKETVTLENSKLILWPPRRTYAPWFNLKTQKTVFLKNKKHFKGTNMLPTSYKSIALHISRLSFWQKKRTDFWTCWFVDHYCVVINLISTNKLSQCG